MASSGTPVFPTLVPVLLAMGLVALQGRTGAADTLTLERPLSGSQRPLVSKSGKFALGFFQPGTKPRRHFLA